MSDTAEPTQAPSIPEAEIPDVPIYRLSVAQYHAMARAGILTEEDRVELLDGWLVPKMTKHRPHVIATEKTRRALARILRSGGYIAAQDSIATAESEPEPDVTLIRGELEDYPDESPGAEHVFLIIEVADTTLRTDRGRKKRLSARARIPVYWIVNLIDRQIEIYTEPAGAGKRADYRQRRDYGLDDAIPVVLDGETVGHLAVRELLP